MTDAYPLKWPDGWPRTKTKARAPFKTSFTSARDSLLKELKMLGAKDVVISTNVELRQDGLPYANRSRPDDAGIAVYFVLNNEEQCIPCDKWGWLADNLHAINKTVAALRGIERWGAKEMVNAAFRGFKALPAPIPMPNILYFADCVDSVHVRQRFKELAKELHPDNGGDTAEFQEMTKQYSEVNKDNK